MKGAFLVAALVGVAACNPYVYQASAPPPGRAARLDPVTGFWGLKHYRLEVSTGVALALTCDHGGPCEKLTVVSEAPAIAEVRPASLAALEKIGFGMQQQPTAAFVVVGMAPGSTKLHVRDRTGHRDITVTVIAPPAPPAPPAPQT